MGVRTTFLHNPPRLCSASGGRTHDPARHFLRLIELPSRQQQTRRKLLDWQEEEKLKSGKQKAEMGTQGARNRKIGVEAAADRRWGSPPKGLEIVLHRWDSSIMTLTADSKGRIACRNLFPPHASFEALKEPDGRVTLIRLRREDRKPHLVKPIVRKGLLVLPMDNGELDSEALDREIREERERENARLLG